MRKGAPSLKKMDTFDGECEMGLWLGLGFGLGLGVGVGVGLGLANPSPHLSTLSHATEMPRLRSFVQ